MRCWLRTKTVWWCTLIKVNRHLNRQFRSVHFRRQFAITCRGDTCVLDDFCENLCRRNMSQKKSNQTEFVRLVAATKFCCRENFSPKNLLYTRSYLSMRCVAATCCCNYSPDLHTEWSVSATCCCNSSPSVFRPLCLIRACLHRGGGPQVGEVTRSGGIPACPYNLSF